MEQRELKVGDIWVNKDHKFPSYQYFIRKISSDSMLVDWTSGGKFIRSQSTPIEIFLNLLEFKRSTDFIIPGSKILLKYDEKEEEYEVIDVKDKPYIIVSNGSVTSSHHSIFLRPKLLSAAEIFDLAKPTDILSLMDSHLKINYIVLQKIGDDMMLIEKEKERAIIFTRDEFIRYFKHSGIDIRSGLGKEKYDEYRSSIGL